MPTISINHCSSCFHTHDDCQCKKIDSCGKTIDECTPDMGCPIQLDADCLIYNKYGLEASELTNLNLPNGSTGKEIFEAIDSALASVAPFAFPSYTANCINYDGFVIATLPAFVSAVDDEFCSVKTSFNTLSINLTNQVNDLTDLIDQINTPGFADACGLGILTTDTLAEVLVKLKDGICSVQADINTDNSPVFSPVLSTSISWATGGIKNHSPIASVRRSATLDNILLIHSDGLYVPPTEGEIQTLSYDSDTRTITLSNGGGDVVLPTDEDNQTLSLNTGTKVITISGGNSINLTPILGSFSQTAITPNNTNSIQLTANGTANTNITANAKISANAGNQISIVADGLFVPESTLPDPETITDEKVKASGAGVVSGYLIDKLEGCDNDNIITTVAYNNITDRVTVCSTIDTTELFTDLQAETDFCDVINACVNPTLCFRFKIVNTHSTLARFYNYIDCSGNTVNAVNINALNSLTILAKGVFSPSDDVLIYNLGFNF